MNARPFRWIWLLTAFATVWLPRASFGCASCFGDPQAAATQGMNLAILTLLGITLCVLGGIAGFMVCLARKSAAVARAQAELELDMDEEEPVAVAPDFNSRMAGHVAHSHHASHSRRSHGRSSHNSPTPRRRFNLPD